jgi:hypothetical protein
MLAYWCEVWVTLLTSFVQHSQEVECVQQQTPLTLL